MNELKIEAYLKKQVEAIGGLCWKWESPGTSGVPDRILILPGGAIAFVETKAPGKTERPQQSFRHEQLRAKGCIVFSSVDSYEKVDEIVKWAKGEREN